MEKTMQNTNFEPWKNRGALPSLRRADILLSCLAVLVSSFGICFFLDERISYILLLPLLVLTVWSLRSPGSVTLVLLTSLLSSVIFASLSGAVVVLSLVVGIGSLAWLFTVSARPYAAALPFVSGIAVWLLTTSLPLAVLSLVILPAAALLAVATVTHQRRTTAICFCIGGLLLTILTGACVILLQTLGTLELSRITEYFDTLRTSFASELVSLRDAFVAALRESASGDAAALAEIEASVTAIEETLTPAMLEAIVALFFSIIPALAVIVCSVIAFEAQLYLNITYYRTGWKDVLTLRATVFSMSAVASVIYAVGFLLTMLVDTTTVFGAALQNVTLMLLPGFCVMGWGALRAALRTSKGGRRVFLILLVVFSTCCTGFSVFYFLALFGAYATLMTLLHLNVMKKLSGPGRSEDHDDGDDGDDGEDDDRT